MFKIPIEISARHLHLSQRDLEMLFGDGYKLSVLKKISQPGEFAAKETLDIISPKNSIKNVRIIGPLRDKTQLELTLTDCYNLGLRVQIRVSGDLKESSSGIILKGPKDQIILKKGVIVAQRHLHIEPELARKFNIKSGDFVSIKTTGVRSLIFNNVMVRSRKGKDKLSFQIDTDEANAAGVSKNTTGELIL